jgi:mRNA interferase MazF
MVMKQYDIYLISLDPSVGHELKKSRPCIVISPDEMNQHISSVIIAPMTTKSHPFPTRVPIEFKGKEGWIVLDQIRTVDKQRLVTKLGQLRPSLIKKVKAVIQEMLVD